MRAQPLMRLWLGYIKGLYRSSHTGRDQLVSLVIPLDSFIRFSYYTLRTDEVKLVFVHYSTGHKFIRNIDDSVAL